MSGVQPPPVRVVLHPQVAGEEDDDGRGHVPSHRAQCLRSTWRLRLVVREATLQISRQRQLGSGGDERCVTQGLVARHMPVEPAQTGGKASTGRGQSLKPQRRKEFRRTLVPGVGEKERPVTIV
jgi:hypothetical protein